MIGDFNKFVLGRQSRRLLALGLLAGGLSLTACGDDDTPKPVPTPDMGEDMADMPDMAENNNNETPAALTVSPIMQNFGSVLLGETSAASTFTVTNTGEADSSAVAVGLEGAASADFTITADTCAGATIAGGATCTISVTFTPSALGELAASLSISAAEGGEASVTLEGTGAGEGDLAITPSLTGFGDVIVGLTSDTRTFTVTNPGTAPTAALTAVVAGDAAAQFAISTDTCAGSELAPGASCEVTIAFTPESRGDKSATLRVTGGEQEVSAGLSGRGLLDAELSLSATNHNFGNLVVGNTSNAFTFTLTNNGDVEAAAVASNVTGDTADFTVASSCGATLAAGASCTIAVAFAPATAGDKSATVDITANPGGTLSATVTGSALTVGDITPSATSHDFGSATVGTTGDSQTFTFTNDGGSPTGVLATALSGTHASNFVIVAGSNSCQGITLASGATCSITIEFAPTNGGQRSAALTVSGTPGGSAVVSLTGEGNLVIPPAEFELTPPSRNFGSIATGSAGDPQVFTVTNVGGQASGTPVVDVITGNFADFEIAANGCTAALAPTEDCEVQVRFRPTTTGTRNSTLRVQGTPGTTETSVLQGVGITPAAIAGNIATAQFGTWVNGSDSATQTVTVTNNGTEATGTLATTIGPQFEITNDTCDGNSLTVGATCAVTFRFAPTTVGVYSEELSVSGTPGGTIAVGLDGISIPEFAISGDNGAFGPEIVGNTTSTQTFTLTNAGPANGAIDRTVNAIVSGAFSAQFNITANACNNSVLTPGDSCDVTIEFSPAGAQGDRTGSLDFTLTGGLTGAVALTGFALELSNDLSFDVIDHDFGNNLVNTVTPHTFTLTNNSAASSGRLSVAFEGGTNFGITNNNCAGATLAQNATCTIEVSFYSTTPGTYTGFMVVSNSVGTTARADFEGSSVTPANLEISGNGDFGTVASTNSATQTFTITNTGGETSGAIATSIPGTLYTITNDECDGVTLEGGDTCTLTVRYLGNANTPLGTRTGTLNASATPGASDSADLTVEAISQLRIVANADFGNQRVGTSSAPRAFTVHNDGTDAVTLSAANSVTLGAPFATVTNNCDGLTIAGGASSPCVSANFTPTAAGLYDLNTITITGNSGPGDDDTIDLSGFGIQPDLSFTAANTSFGFVITGQSVVRTFTLNNTGDDFAAPVDFTLTQAGTDFSVTDNCGASLAAGASCTYTVTFAPTTIGAKSATINVDNTMGSLATAQLSVSGTAVPAGGLTITPTLAAFADTEEGEESGLITFTVTNTNIVVATNLAINLPGTEFCYGSDATNSTNSCGATGPTDTCTGTNLNPNASCTFQARFTPGSDGMKSAVATVSGGNVTSALTELVGNGLESAFLVLNPNTNPFTTDTAADSTSTFEITVTNLGEVPSGAISVAKIGGQNPALFLISNNTCTVLAGGDSCTFDLTFAPQNLEVTATTTLRVAAVDDNTVDVALSAESVPPPTLTVTPTANDCGTDVRVATVNNCQTITVENEGALPTEDMNFVLSGAEFTITGGTCVDGDPIAAGDDCTVTVSYTSPTVGTHTGAVTFTAGALTSVSTLTGNSVSALVPNVATYDFEEVAVSCVNTRTFFFTNQGNTPSSALSVSFTGANASEFTYDSDCPGKALAALGGPPALVGCEVTVFFLPTSTGDKVAELVVTDGTTEIRSSIALTGEGTPVAQCILPGAYQLPAFAPEANTGTSVSLGDDQSTTLPIGFNFNYFGTTYNSVVLCSNGFLRFGGNTACPFTRSSLLSNPNMVAFPWNDWNPGQGGSITYETRGTAGDRRFVVSFTNVPRFVNNNPGTFQVVLYESTGFIDMHTTSTTDTNTMVQGVSSPDGTTAFFLPGRNLGVFPLSNDSVRFITNP